MHLAVLAWTSLGIAVLCAVIVAVDEQRHPQHMGVMNVVWPVTALYFSVFALWAYFTLGRRNTREAMQAMRSMDGMQDGRQGPPTPAQVAVGTSHCGAGCMIADLVTEFAIAAGGVMLFGSMLATDFLLDFIAAWALGVVFQYFAIRPMQPGLSATQALVKAIKADTLSIVAFQVGMYAFMALTQKVLFPAPHALTVWDPRYWLMMQFAMICGFATSFPMNRWLIRRGLKEAM